MHDYHTDALGFCQDTHRVNSVVLKGNMYYCCEETSSKCVLLNLAWILPGRSLFPAGQWHLQFVGLIVPALPTHAGLLHPHPRQSQSTAAGPGARPSTGTKRGREHTTLTAVHCAFILLYSLLVKPTSCMVRSENRMTKFSSTRTMRPVSPSKRPAITFTWSPIRKYFLNSWAGNSRGS